MWNIGLVVVKTFKCGMWSSMEHNVNGLLVDPALRYMLNYCDGQFSQTDQGQAACCSSVIISFVIIFCLHTTVQASHAGICCSKLPFTVIKVTFGLKTVLISYPLNHHCAHNHSSEHSPGYYCYNMTHHMTISQWNPNVTLWADENWWRKHSRDKPIKLERTEESTLPVFYCCTL